LHQVAHGLVNDAVALDRGFAVELIRDHQDAEMSAAVFGAFVAYVQVSLVLYLQGFGRQLTSTDS